MLVLASLAFAQPSLGDRATGPAGHVQGRSELSAAFDAASAEFGVPSPLLLAIAYEASHFNPDAESRWGGHGLFDLREGERDPSLEHAAALLEVNPNLLAADWRLSVRGAAAILADQGRLSNGGELPAAADLLAWWDAVRAFSGREEPLLQNHYAVAIFELAQVGAVADTRWGTVLLAPHDLDLTGYLAEAPPSGTDSAVASNYYAACSENYSDYSRGASDIDMIVIHTVQGSYSGCASWFANCSAQASAHYVVRSSDGEVTQMVREADVGWHAGNWDYNERSVGIEHEGYVSDCGYYTDAMYAGSAALTADIASRQGVPLDRSHIIGHNEVPDPDGSGTGGSGGHTDPGSCWDWDYYMTLLSGEVGVSGGEIIGVVADSDVYNGARLVGASVWIAETGETTSVGSDGFYRFQDVPFGTYTMHATADGYAEGTCTKATSSSQDWCSIILYPEDDGGGDTDTDAGDTDPPDADPDDTDPRRPGSPVRLDDVAVCGTASGMAPAGGLAWLGAALLLWRRGA